MVQAGEQGRDAATARPIIRPPLLFIGCIILGFVLDRMLPLPFKLSQTAMVPGVAGGGLVALGAAMFAAAVRNFSRASTPVPSTRPVRALVTTGVHGISRNPIYVGMFLLYVGIGVGASGPWILILALPLVIVMRYVVVAHEEAYLERHFGEAYRGYRAGVRRWL